MGGFIERNARDRVLIALGFGLQIIVTLFAYIKCRLLFCRLFEVLFLNYSRGLYALPTPRHNIGRLMKITLLDRLTLVDSAGARCLPPALYCLRSFWLFNF